MPDVLFGTMLRVVIAESFEFDGRDYETRVTFDFSTRTYTARAYLAGQAANPFSHSLHEDTNCDFHQLHERPLVEGIMKEAKRDVVERIWEGSILKARRELKVPRSKSRSLVPIQGMRSAARQNERRSGVRR
jgi:hypothetical protein